MYHEREHNSITDCRIGLLSAPFSLFAHTQCHTSPFSHAKSFPFQGDNSRLCGHQQAPHPSRVVVILKQRVSLHTETRFYFKKKSWTIVSSRIRKFNKQETTQAARPTEQLHLSPTKPNGALEMVSKHLAQSRGRIPKGMIHPISPSIQPDDRSKFNHHQDITEVRNRGMTQYNGWRKIFVFSPALGRRVLAAQAWVPRTW